MSNAVEIFRFKELSDLDGVSDKLLKFGREFPIWFFEGQMGAGKTTLIKALCKNLGVTSMVHSPTFSLVNEYITSNRLTIYHFDFYRIMDEVEALDIGVEEYFDSGDFCFVEWPQKIEGLWPLEYLLLNLSLNDDGERELVVEKVGR